MKVLVALVFLPLVLIAKEPVVPTNVLIDFAEVEEKAFGRITNDGVMGGLSKGQVSRTENGTALFQGTLSLENNGGFSSWQIRKGKWDLSTFQGIQMKVKGDGRSYKIRLGTTETHRFSPVAFQAGFDTDKDKWIIVTVPFSALKASWRGRSLDNPFDSSNIRTIGIILADKKEGSFAIEVRKVSSWKNPSSS